MRLVPSCRSPERRRLAWLVGALGLLLAPAVHAHGAKVGDIRVEHPYAPPTVASAKHGAVHFRALRNVGTQPDRLLGARTPVAGAVEIHRMSRDGDVMRMRALDALDLPPGAALAVQPGGEFHLMLLDLKAPLVDGTRFPLTLRFERGGEKEVTVWVQAGRGDEHHGH